MRVPFTDILTHYLDTRHRRVFDLRRDGLREIPSFGWCAYPHAQPDLPLHRHPGVLEMCYLERGNQVFQVQDQEYRLRGGDVFVTFPDEPHSTGGWPVEPCILYWFYVRLPKPGSRLLSLPTRQSALLADALRGLPRRHFRGSPLIKALLHKLMQLHDHPQVLLRELRMKHTFIDLLVEAVNCASRNSGPELSRVMAGVIHRIESQPQEDFRLQDLARQARLSLSGFKARFKAETGISPRQFIVRTKIAAACARLRTGGDSILHISLDLGFPSSQYFATVFKRLTGLTPTAYRRGAAAPRVPSSRSYDGQG